MHYKSKNTREETAAHEKHQYIFRSWEADVLAVRGFTELRKPKSRASRRQCNLETRKFARQSP